MAIFESNPFHMFDVNGLYFRFGRHCGGDVGFALELKTSFTFGLEKLQHLLTDTL